MGARRLGQDEQYLTVREILSEASTLSDGALSRERNDFYRFGYATLESIPLIFCLQSSYAFRMVAYIVSNHEQDSKHVTGALPFKLPKDSTIKQEA